ncbi:MAG: deoxyribodipyrimidine photo-lyase [Rhodospirillaceae bacterium]|nr:MAG: deoxyribodipyrimidine photo-lyase [Rhodospirillaceae bacterium]
MRACDVRDRLLEPNTLCFLRALGEREFCHHLFHHTPELSHQPLRHAFALFPWRDDRATIAAWTRGETGFPIVDAGMRELERTGWMHNLLRMIVASFLVKDLLVSWQVGAQWFQERLVDADVASNAVNWQGMAGCGVDTVPYFRMCNPVVQGEKCDPRGHYVRQWVPELAGMPDVFLHRPWEASADVLMAAGVVLDRTYPYPIVDHALARRRALAAYQQTVRTSAA